MYNIDRRNWIDIGRQGENAAVNIEFDVTAWLNDYPNGTFEALCVRPGDEDIYPVNTTLSEGILSWQVSAYETEFAGIGSLEVRLVDGDVLKKSITNVLQCTRSLSGSGGSAPARPGWVEEVLQAGEDAKDSAEAAQASEAAALLASNTAVESAGAAAEAAAAAEAGKDAAEAAQAAAESAAELARQRAYGLTEDTDGLVFTQPDGK